MISTERSTRNPIRLADFIRAHMEQILQKWENFAKTILPAAKSMDTSELRDHAEQMLRAIALDLEQYQSSRQQLEKSLGQAPDSVKETAAETHALTRLMSGFTIDQMVSEYRALRASVLTLWAHEVTTGGDLASEDITRFNEAIDQALAESVGRYSQAVSETQNIFLGILGHDLRTPLGVINMASELLLRDDSLDSRHKKVASRISASVERASGIVESLLDVTRSQLGGGIPILPESNDLSLVCGNIVEEVRAHHPERVILCEARPGLHAHCDAARMAQVFCNLIENAVQHGDDADRVTVFLSAQQDHIEFSVHNQGEPIAESDLPNIFSPMSRHSRFASNDRDPGSGLGLGLYIAHEIVMAHGGKIEVESTAEKGTTFLVKLPVKGD
jgi:signal transduction histidine kinase